MRQSELNRAVAKATGETIQFIESLGFQHVEVPVFRPRRHRRRQRRKHWPRPVALTA